MKKTITKKKPNILAIVETWLNKTHENEFLLEGWLLLNNYRIFRQDRYMPNLNNAYVGPGELLENPNGRKRGGGILVAWNANEMDNLEFSHDTSEDLYDNIMNFKIEQNIKCKKCGPKKRNFAISVIYRRDPGKKNILIDLKHQVVQLSYHFFWSYNLMSSKR